MNDCKLYFSLIVWWIFCACKSPIRNPASEPDCKPLSDAQKKIYLYKSGHEEFLNASLQYFNQLPADSCFRIWYMTHGVQNNIGTYQLQFFESGVRQQGGSTNASADNKNSNQERHYANYSSIEIEGYGGDDSTWTVKCVKSNAVVPAQGWTEFGNPIQWYGLDHIYPMPERENGMQICNECLLMLQYIKQKDTVTIDFTYQLGTYPTAYPRDKSFLQLVNLVNKEFNIKIGYNQQKGHKEIVSR